MTLPELKPCPFCGGKPYLANVELVGCSYVVCTDCRAQGDDMSKDHAILSWNTRTAPFDPLSDPRVKALVESERERAKQAVWSLGHRIKSSLLVDEDREPEVLSMVKETAAFIRSSEGGKP
jgi:Lar family restriction alleviation protein